MAEFAHPQIAPNSAIESPDVTISSEVKTCYLPLMHVSLIEKKRKATWALKFVPWSGVELASASAIPKFLAIGQGSINGTFLPHYEAFFVPFLLHRGVEHRTLADSGPLDRLGIGRD
jgi:hypothetical protein